MTARRVIEKAMRQVRRPPVSEPVGAVVFELPWPPSANHYYRRVGPRTLISRAGRAFRDLVGVIVRPLGLVSRRERLAIEIEATPPDTRRRDLDNVLKSLLDALQAAGVYEDDSQIDALSIVRLPASEPGGVRIRVQSIAGRATAPPGTDDADLAAIERRIRQIGPANCWTGTSGSIAAVALELVRECRLSRAVIAEAAARLDDRPLREFVASLRR